VVTLCVNHYNQRGTDMSNDTMAPADQLRAAFKAAGFNARQVSVRHDHYSMGSTMYVTVRDVTVPFALAQRIARTVERVDRDEATGEILCGGNRFVDVSHSPSAVAILARRHSDALQAACDKCDPSSNLLEPIAGTPHHVGSGNFGGLRLWFAGDGPGLNFGKEPGCIERAAYQLALHDPDQL